MLASAPVLVLANAHEAQQLLPQQHWTVRRVRGQLTTLPASQVEAIGDWPDCVVTGAGYLLPRAGSAIRRSDR